MSTDYKFCQFMWKLVELFSNRLDELRIVGLFVFNWYFSKWEMPFIYQN